MKRLSSLRRPFPDAGVTLPQAKVNSIETPLKRSGTKRRILLLFLAAILSLPVFLVLYNNLSLQSDQAFELSLGTAITNAVVWTENNREVILGKYVNINLLKMLQDCNLLRPTSVLKEILNIFVASSSKPLCYKSYLDPIWPVDTAELKQVFEQEELDYQWMSYALHPDLVGADPEKMGLWDRNRWNGRKLTHQLIALVYYSERNRTSSELKDLIEHLCTRLARQMHTDIRVNDIYIQKVGFILYAGHPEKVKRRWIERIIQNQNADGGWDDNWLCFISGRRLRFDKTDSDQHATLQALWTLYFVKYKYPACFNLPQYP